MSTANKKNGDISRSGRIPWNKGLHDGTCKGFTGKHTPESKEKMRLAKLGKPGNHTKPHTEEAKQRISESHKGIPAWNKGIKMPKSFGAHMSEIQKNRPVPQEQRDKIRKSLEGREHSEEHNMKVLEANIGGFWIGNVRYSTKPIYCERWKDVNPRVHAFFDYKCVECGAPENGQSHIGHHVFYVKESCCWYDESGIYYTNLNAKDHKENDYLIGDDPNYFVILCNHCHGKTNGKFANRKKWADHFKELIDTKYGGKCYLTPEEFEVYKREKGLSPL